MVITRPDQEGVLVASPHHSFSRSDTLSVPSGYEAILVQDGASAVYREGDAPKLGQGLFKKPGSLYFVQQQPTAPLPWGMGGCFIGQRRCGLHGTLRLRVSSSRLFFRAHEGLELPLTEGRVFEGILEPFQTAVRGALERESRATRPEETVHRPDRIAQSACALLEEPLERLGLSVEELIVEITILSEEG